MDEILFVGVDPGLFSTTAAVMSGNGQLIAIKSIYASEEEYPRVARVKRKSGQRKHDPICEQIAFDHYFYMQELITNYSPEAVGAESMVWTPSGSDNHALTSHFRGVMHGCCIQNKTSFQLITPSAIKKAATGNGTADKRDVVKAIYDKYGDALKQINPRFTVTYVQKYNHIADAIGCALHLIAGEMNWLDDSEEMERLEGR